MELNVTAASMAFERTVARSATLCYMGDESPRVGVRELRQNLSVFLRRVKRGETLEVTERGRPVAILGPLPKGSPIDRLRAAGKVRPAEGDLLTLGAPQGEISTRAGEALQAGREERV